MITVRKSDDRGHLNHGWLDTYHTFSFGEYYDPKHMRFRALRVINEDRVAPGAGFPKHPHHDMEIISYVIDGAIAHRDSLGHGATLRPGEVQVMSAGTGIEHSEFNPEKDQPLHLLQIWIMPRARNLPARWDQKAFPMDDRHNRLRTLVSEDGRDGSLTIQQDAQLLGATLDAGQSISHRLDAERHAWVQVVRGRVNVNGETLDAGDGAGISEEEEITVRAEENAELLVFDLA